MDNVTDQETRKFFESFERLNAVGDVDGIVGLYAASFLMAGAGGTQVVKASDLAFVIPKRRQMVASMGCPGARLVSLEERKLDDRYMQVRCEFRWQFQPEAAAPVEITLPSTFIVEKTSEGFRIVFYLTGDLMGAMRQRGLLPQP